MGGVFDGETKTWRSLPEGAREPRWEGEIVPVAGGFNENSGTYSQPVGQILDVSSGRWLTMRHPTVADEDKAVQTQSLVTNAGRDAVAFEGGAVWLWRAP